MINPLCEPPHGLRIAGRVTSFRQYSENGVVGVPNDVPEEEAVEPGAPRRIFVGG
jgi:hypothetical protein